VAEVQAALGSGWWTEKQLGLKFEGQRQPRCCVEILTDEQEDDYRRITMQFGPTKKWKETLGGGSVVKYQLEELSITSPYKLY
jgi:hypothetical protein